MRKIHVTRQFFKNSGHHGDFLKKQKNLFLDKVNGSMCAKIPNFRSVSFFIWPGELTQINKYTHKYTNIQVKIGISSTSCTPHVDFENLL